MATTNPYYGTSFHGLTIKTNMVNLKKAFGSPTYCDGDKVNYEWELMTDDGLPFTIYDWKEYYLTPKTIVHYHVGHHKASDAGKIQQYIQSKL